jgi:anaerobic dimethyl sulfoxide reductase subunit C (anchor subunit)
MAVGTLWVFVAVRAVEPEAPVRPVVPMIVLMLVAGAAAALLHLSRPAQAQKAIGNLGSSWLSREILLVVLFGISLIVYGTLFWQEAASPAALDVIGLVCAVLGVVLVGAMARIYMIRTVPAWNSPVTPVSFFSTTLLLGLLAVGAELTIATPVKAGEPVHMVAGWLGAVAAIVLFVQVGLIPLHTARLRAQEGVALKSAIVMLVDYRSVLLSRIILSLLGVGLFNLAIFCGTTAPYVAVAGFVLALAGETTGRFLFYASYRRVGL